MDNGPTIRLAVAGTGFVSRNFAQIARARTDLRIVKVLTRRPIESCREFPAPSLLTNSVEEALSSADVLVECSGDVVYSTDVIAAAVTAGVPVVTLNSQFHVTAGSYFVGRGLISESEGDQPGSIAALAAETAGLGFKPLVYGAIKGYLNHNPTPEDMDYWAKKNGISLPMVTSFTDGTKLHIEQALVANGLGATIAPGGMIGPAQDDLKAGADILGEAAEAVGSPISDYVLSLKLPHGVFVVARHEEHQAAALRYLKAGDGPYYVILKHNIFAHLELPRSIRRLMEERKPLLDNSSTPRVSVNSIAKRDLAPGERIHCGVGSFAVRGEAIPMRDFPGHLPIGLLNDGIVRRPVKAGSILTFDDVELPESLALKAWIDVQARALSAVSSKGTGV